MTSEGTPSQNPETWLDDFLKDHTPILPPGMTLEIIPWEFVLPAELTEQSGSGSVAMADVNQRLLWAIMGDGS